MNRLIAFLVLIISLPSIANAIDVGGHLTEDTTWSPLNNPYHVTETLYVDAGVTLTILPGTVIKIKGAEFDDEYDGVQNFWLNSSGWSVAKYIRVDGRIIAEGTEDDKIIFTRMQDDPNYNWGSICITIDAELSIFKHCLFEHMGNTGLAVSNISKGLAFFNGKGIVRNSKFLNCVLSISSTSYEKELEIIDNEFITDNNINPYLYEPTGGNRFISSARIGTYEAKDVLICNNLFDGSNNYSGFYAKQMSLAYNTVKNCISNGGANYFFSNDFIDCTRAINSSNYNSLYIKQNRFIGGSDGINLDHTYVEICDNYFEDCDLDTDFYSSGKINNNIANNGSIYAPGQVQFYNNISYNNQGNIGLCATFQCLTSTNNISINNHYAFEACYEFNNSILLDNYELEFGYVTGNPIFRNCIIDFPLDPPLVDGGGNIIVNEIQAQYIFEDIQNGDFHLAQNSIAIDAGFDTLGYYYPFDIEKNLRLWDGDGDGNAIIDIGAYEYGAPPLGRIIGYITETDTSDPVDYVKLLINNDPGNFTFADSSGYFEIQLPEGTYDLYAERVFYEDNTIYTVTVENDLVTPVFFNMTSILPEVGIAYNEVQSVSGLNLSNYPNPFNPSTTISYNLDHESDVRVEVYNTKGQKVKTLLNKKMAKGQHSVFWNGLNEKNKSVSSSVYLYKVKAGNQESIKRMILLK